VWQSMCFDEWTRKPGDDDNGTEDHQG
jgi:hypothetical protein